MEAAEVQKIAVVTGANRGLGLEISRQLALRGVRVVMTARDPEKGKQAWEGLRRQGLCVEYLPLDVTVQASVEALARSLAQTFGGLDILVNNAGILPEGQGARALSLGLEVFRQAFETNALGALRLCQALVPLMKKRGGGRIVNVSSGLAQLTTMGTGTPAYRVSKTALNALTRILAAELEAEGIKVNAACPGWVRTDMGGPDAPRSVAEGADTPVWLALLPEDGPTGGFFRDRQPIPW
ncbi:SDR family oxidoreductase [Pelomicrobium sp.]|jgi:NAD(P)-dependent dehydrogenase (short-subunit alcohol dehydrogenase family)|uniref:SDR family oxidoreductase n=1 Tax=Pelomicrobium sp. TaxID=2815319 RepID=UPI002FDE2124